MERIGWIDFLRGMAMIAILAFHTEVYYKGFDTATPYYIYTTNAIILFYFISGYLLYRKNGFDFKRKIVSIGRSLLMPYFIFTTLIAIPKTLAHGEDINIQELTIKILSGQASWFIAALIVAELIFSIILRISKGKHGLMTIFSVFCFIAYTLIPYNQYNYWQWQDALLAVPFLYIGYLYHQYEKTINTPRNPLYSYIITTVLTWLIYHYVPFITGKESHHENH